MSLLSAQQTEQNRRAVGMAGGRCDTERRVPTWLQSLAGENFPTIMDHTVIVGITMTGDKIGDEHLAKIPPLHDVEAVQDVNRWPGSFGQDVEIHSGQRGSPSG
jgi:hypothetical protein